MTSEDKIEKVFNQDLLNNEDFLRVVKEIISDLEKRSDIPAGMIAQEIKAKYKITDIPVLDMETNVWHQCTKDIPGFEPQVQGWRIASKPEGQTKVPLGAYTVDFEHGEAIIKSIIENYNKFITNKK